MSIDIEQVDINKSLALRIKELSQDLLVPMNANNELDLTNSKFVRDPVVKVERALSCYDFLPIKKESIV